MNQNVKIHGVSDTKRRQCGNKGDRQETKYPAAARAGGKEKAAPPDGGTAEVVEKASQSFAARRRNKMQVIFSGGVYVGKNTSRPANVRAQRVRCGGV
jgi:hypothetical protein